MENIQISTSPFVTVFISSTKNEASFNEKRFPKDIIISELKAKLELITGADCSTMQIKAYDKEKYICTLSNNEALLGSYPIDDGMTLHVIGDFNLTDENAENIKYMCTDEDYAKKTDTVRAYLMKNKLGKYNDGNIEKKKQMVVQEQQQSENILVGSRCKVVAPNCPCRLGTVMYTGAIESLSGFWIGVKYDEPLGKNDGSFNNKKYFECANNYGAFVKPQYVECGNFPENDYDLNEEI